MAKPQTAEGSVLHQHNLISKGHFYFFQLFYFFSNYTDIAKMCEQTVGCDESSPLWADKVFPETGTILLRFKFNNLLGDKTNSLAYRYRRQQIIPNQSKA